MGNTQKNTPVEIQVRIDKLLDGDSSTKAFASATIGNAFAVHDIRITEKDDKVIVNMPFRSYKANGETKYVDTFHAGTAPFFARLASAADMTVAEKFDESVVSADTAVQVITPSATAYLPLADLIDFEKEKARLASEITKLEGEVKRLEGKLGNAGFVAKAPAAVVDAEKAKLAAAQEKLTATQAALAKLG